MINQSLENHQDYEAKSVQEPLHHGLGMMSYMNVRNRRRKFQLRTRVAIVIAIILLLSRRTCDYVFADDALSPVTAPFDNAPAWVNPARAPRASSAATPRIPSTRSPSSNPLFDEAATAQSSSDSPSFSWTGPPTYSTSSAPSVTDTMENTSTPTSAPETLPSISTGNPTDDPTMTISILATVEPVRSLPPSDQLTPVPSHYPTQSPIVQPTIKPTNIETDSPSRMITVSPSSTPSSAPTAEPQSSLVVVIMLLSDTNGTLVGKTAIDFVATTEAHIKQSIQSMKVAEQLLQLSVEAIIDDQRIVPLVESRRLQEMAPLQVAFNVLLRFQSNTTEFDTSEWIKDAFNSSSDRAAYIDRLQKRNSDFDSVTRIDVKVNGDIPDDVEPPIVDQNAPEDDSNMMLWIIVGSAAGGSVVLLALALFFCRRGSTKDKSPKSSAIKSSLGPTSADETSKMGYAAEINVDRQDDISTLGDPVFGGHVGGMLIDDMEQRDEYTASVGPDYDYSKHYLGASTSASMGTHALNIDSNDQGDRDRLPSDAIGSLKHNLHPSSSSGFDDDDVSFEEQYNPEAKRGHSSDTFEVEVPPGKLGMVIDTPNNGVPVVHAIKQESVLCDRVQVGDRLIFVDGEDVTSMTAVQVSKLISLKSDQQRVLVFQGARDLNASQSSGSLGP